MIDGLMPVSRTAKALGSSAMRVSIFAFSLFWLCEPISAEPTTFRCDIEFEGDELIDDRPLDPSIEVEGPEPLDISVDFEQRKLYAGFIEMDILEVFSDQVFAWSNLPEGDGSAMISTIILNMADGRIWAAIFANSELHLGTGQCIHPIER